MWLRRCVLRGCLLLRRLWVGLDEERMLSSRAEEEVLETWLFVLGFLGRRKLKISAGMVSAELERVLSLWLEET